MAKTFPCRLYVILARDADVGVILRRGPTRWVQVIRWDTGRDTFDDGAWFHGRIYEDRCDLSPDGELLVYFAAKHNRGVDNDGDGDGYGYAWTAVSRPPWLEALALWPSPCGTYGGGGHFVEDRALTLLTAGMDVVPHPRHAPPRELKVVQQTWTEFVKQRPRSFETSTATSVPEGVDWWGHDRRGRLVFARAGKLFRRVGNGDRELMDFNDRVPDPKPAPAWAGEWLGRSKRRG